MKITNGRWLLLILTLNAISLALIFGCEDGQDGAEGRDGADGECLDDDGQPTQDDDGPNHPDDDETSYPDDDDSPPPADDDDGGLQREDLDYADECPALATCVLDHCAQFSDPDSYALLQCTLVDCPDDYADCFGAYGDGLCVNVLKCLEECLPGDCLDECMDAASYEALLAFAAAGVCVEENCPSALADPLSNIGCFLGACNDPIAVCCGGTIFGCM